MLLDKAFLFAVFFKALFAVPVTLNITVVSLILSFPIALTVALARIKKISPISQIGAVFVSLSRGTPIVLQILIVYSLLPSMFNALCKKYFPAVNVFNLNPIFYAYIVFTFNTAAVMSEVLRSGISSVPRAQYEAALCSGLTPFRAYSRIIMPQAFSRAMPNLCNLTVTLIKNTSLAFMMTVKDITAVAKIEASFGYNYVEAYLDIFAVYVIVCMAVQAVFKCIEHKMNYNKGRKGRHQN